MHSLNKILLHSLQPSPPPFPPHPTYHTPTHKKTNFIDIKCNWIKKIKIKKKTTKKKKKKTHTKNYMYLEH